MIYFTVRACRNNNVLRQIAKVRKAMESINPITTDDTICKTIKFVYG